MIKTIKFPTYSEAKEYCDDNNIDYHLIQYNGDYSTVDVNFNDVIDTSIESDMKECCYKICFVNSLDKTSYITIIAHNKDEAIKIAKKKLGKEIYRIVDVFLNSTANCIN